MGYMQQFEQELRAQLAKGDTDASVRWIKEKVLESYRNGLAVGKSPRSPQSRQRKQS